MSHLHDLGRKDLAEYFRHQLEHELNGEQQQETRWYLGDLLARFSRSDQLFSHCHGDFSLRPLAMLYDDAQQCSHERERCLVLRQLGDQALFMGALFPEHYAGKGIQRDYFIGMGGGAYEYLSHHAHTLKQVFAELAERFAHLLELLAHICQRHRRYSASEVMALYQRWHHSRNPVLAEQLRSIGINLDEGPQRPH
ncbi:hypothetical protein [Motiliproteus sediminis]|uniref:hypothetical protein n=1 Tax=Motiliproteus sediminis TaxID=1468178 RepID=UPI001AF0209C|nr:hypothetical protein [Motiliproteus sediminis]